MSVHTKLYVYMYVHMYACAHARTHTHTQTHTNTHTHVGDGLRREDPEAFARNRSATSRLRQGPGGPLILYYY